MKIEMGRGENLYIKAPTEQLQVVVGPDKRMAIHGHSTITSVDYIEYEDAIIGLEEKFFAIGMEYTKSDDVKASEARQNEAKEAIAFIRQYVDWASNYLRLDRTTILTALERRRDYHFQNYYQRCNFPNTVEIPTLRAEISGLMDKINTLEKAHAAEILDWQKKVMDAEKMIDLFRNPRDANFAKDLMAKWVKEG